MNTPRKDGGRAAPTARTGSQDLPRPKPPRRSPESGALLKINDVRVNFFRTGWIGVPRYPLQILWPKAA